MGNVEPEWLSEQTGKTIQSEGVDQEPRKKLNFVGDVTVTDDELGNRTNVSVELGITYQEIYDNVIGRATEIIISGTLGEDSIDPGTPAEGIVLFSSGGYAQVRDSHGGLATIVGVPRADLPDGDTEISVDIANDWWLWDNTLTAECTYYAMNYGATYGSCMTLELLDASSGFAAQIWNGGTFPVLLFTKPAFRAVVLDIVYDGANWQVAGWKYRTQV